MAGEIQIRCRATGPTSDVTGRRWGVSLAADPKTEIGPDSGEFGGGAEAGTDVPPWEWGLAWAFPTVERAMQRDEYEDG